MPARNASIAMYIQALTTGQAHSTLVLVRTFSAIVHNVEMHAVAAVRVECSDNFLKPPVWGWRFFPRTALQGRHAAAPVQC